MFFCLFFLLFAVSLAMLEVNVVEKKMGGKKENKMVIVEGRNINTKQYIYI